MEMSLELPRGLPRARPEQVAVVAPEVVAPTMGRWLARGRDVLADLILRRSVRRRLAPFLAAKSVEQVDRLVRANLSWWLLDVVTAHVVRRSAPPEYSQETRKALDMIEEHRSFERDADAAAWNALRVVLLGQGRCLRALSVATTALDGPTNGAFVRSMMLANVLLLWAVTEDHTMADEALGRVAAIAMGDVDHVTRALARLGAFGED